MELCKFRNEYVFRFDVNLSDELFIKSAVAALAVCWCRVEFIGTVNLDILE